MLLMVHLVLFFLMDLKWSNLISNKTSQLNCRSLKLTDGKILLQFPAKQRNKSSVVWIEWIGDFIPKLRIVKCNIARAPLVSGAFLTRTRTHGEVANNWLKHCKGGKKRLILKCVQGSQISWSQHSRLLPRTAGLTWKRYSVSCEKLFLSLFLQTPAWGPIYSKHSKSLSLQQPCLYARPPPGLRTAIGEGSNLLPLWHLRHASPVFPGHFGKLSTSLKALLGNQECSREKRLNPANLWTHTLTPLLS